MRSRSVFAGIAITLPIVAVIFFMALTQPSVVAEQPATVNSDVCEGGWELHNIGGSNFYVFCPSTSAMWYGNEKKMWPVVKQ